MTTTIVPVLLAAAMGFGAWSWVENQSLQQSVQLLSEEKKALENANALLLDANSRMSQALTQQKASSEITDKITEELADQTQLFVNEVEKFRKMAQQRMKEITDAYARKEDTPENREAMRVDIGMERARGIWRMYCLAEPAAKECTQ